MAVVDTYFLQAYRVRIYRLRILACPRYLLVFGNFISILVGPACWRSTDVIRNLNIRRLFESGGKQIQSLFFSFFFFFFHHGGKFLCSVIYNIYTLSGCFSVQSAHKRVYVSTSILYSNLE